jgi:Ala-tRNA(Pro) deacylase
MNVSVTLDRPFEPLLDWLAGHDIEYEVHQHDEAFTAQATAAAEGVDPRSFAKVVAVASNDGRRAIVVIDATDQLDLRKARRVLDCRDVRLLTEQELTALAPGCELGAIPAVGALFGLTTYAD